MKCERCGKNEATFYYKSSINGKVTELHLCPECAEALGYTESLRSTWRLPSACSTTTSSAALRPARAAV